jgi:BolA family transcriptional regulator, general stress-responsive regulator
MEPFFIIFDGGHGTDKNGKNLVKCVEGELGALFRGRQMGRSERRMHLFSFWSLLLMTIQRERMQRAMQQGPVYTLLQSRITQGLKPSFLIIENESHRHKSRGETESHFKVLVVSDSFENVATIDRHRLVNKVVSDEDGGMPCHALSIKAMTPQQFASKPEAVAGFQTPPCAGGDGSHVAKQ